ncbi:arylsulfatase [Stieleria varia]|uniref:Arylsulfatase n=1 Tax=Stieleria varia TaxID=2528005 RepID=A0A5C5ZVE8_9BACT|nr:arylsulfatase [Stieleria varia]TWT91522.1 Arylsulfatase [Stieleria varia]
MKSLRFVPSKAICFAVVAQSLIVFLSPGIASSQEAEQPNIVFIMTDDQGYWDTGVTGNPHIDTPNMDRIATSGVQLDRYYAAPVCAPTRAGIMTGRYYLRTGLYNTRFGGDSLGLEEITVAQLLHSSGYRTGLFGKWHLGKYPGYQPQDRGFDEFFGHYHGHIERYEFPNQVYHNGRPVEARGYVSDLFTDAAIDFIDHAHQKQDGPFFCALMYNAPHSPFLLDTSHFGQPEGDVTLTKYLERGLPIREARIYALVERVDQNIGRLLQRLDELGISNDTLVVFTSDNGGVSKFWKGGMKGNKSGSYEGGVRAPCFVRWPKRIAPGRVVNAQTSHVDWLPTFCELAGAEPPSDRPIDGKSLVSLFRGEATETHHRYVYHTWDRYVPNPDKRWGISDDRWKLLCQLPSGVEPSRLRWQLYDLSVDPGETNNLIKDHPAVVERLRNEFVRWFEEVTQGQTYQPIAIPVGAEEPTEMEPSWATTSGDNIEYVFDGYDWDTIESWRSPGETATWRLQVSEAGNYRVHLIYGCRPVDAGGHVELRAGESSIRHQVIATATADQFESRDVGEIELSRGPVEFAASVIDCPGTELMRLNRVRLTRVTEPTR